MRYASYPYRRALLRGILSVIGLVHSTVSGPVRCSWARTISAYIKLESPGSSSEASPLDPGHILRSHSVEFELLNGYPTRPSGFSSHLLVWNIIQVPQLLLSAPARHDKSVGLTFALLCSIQGSIVFDSSWVFCSGQTGVDNLSSVCLVIDVSGAAGAITLLSLYSAAPEYRVPSDPM